MWVNSSAELLALQIAFEEYQHIWRLLTETGLAFIPLIGCFIQSLVKLYGVANRGTMLGSLLSQFEIQFFSMGCCLMVCCQPFVVLDITKSGTAQGEKQECAIETVQDSVKVPLLWAGISGVSSAFLYALLHALKQGENARATEVSLSITVIQNVALFLEIKSFMEECYEPSLRKYFREQEKNIDRDHQDIAVHNQLNRAARTLWVGDELFMTEGGYYDYFTSSSRFELQESLGGPTETSSANQYLSCKAWWGEPLGLKNRLIEELKKHVPSLAQYLIDGDWSLFLKRVIHQSLARGYSSGLTEARSEELSGIGRFLSKVMGQYGLAKEALSFYPLMSVVIEALPLFQALMMMGGIIFYPFWIVLTRYSFKASIQYILFWVSIEFWSYLFGVAAHIDHLLIQSLYPGLSFDIPGKLLIDMVALVMYLVLPLCWSVVVNRSFFL